MTLLNLIVVIVVVGVVLWAINTYVPMQAGAKKILNIVVLLVLVFWLLDAFGLLTVLHRRIR
jgi:hypothetical protein